MALIINHVSHVYSPNTPFERVALNDVTLKINDGEMIGIIGHTGSGKSTLVQHMNGLLKATDGGIYYNGQDIYDKDFSLKELRGKVGIVFQYPEHQLFETTVLEDVKFGPKNFGVDKLHVDLRAFEALKQVGITDDLYDVSPLDLSGGQKRRVAIAGVLAMEPEVLVLDEPTAGLDPKGRKDMYELLLKLRKERKITVIVVSHSMEDMAEYVDRVIVMNDGSVVFDDAPEAVFSNVDKLEGMGLMAPELSYVMRDLKAQGFDVDANAITLESAKNSILKAIRKR